MQVVVVGGGPAGIAAAIRAAELGAAVTLAEGRALGGTCVNDGCVPTRVLARTARMVREARDASRWGVEVAEVGVDWDRVRARVAETVAAIHDAKALPDVLASAGVELLLGEPARFVDPSTVAVGDRSIHADAAILCVGGSARRLSFPGAELATLPDAVPAWGTFPDRVAVVGSGSTGAQLVTVLDSLGADVTLLDVAPRVLPHADADVADALTRAFTRHGVAVRTGIGGIESIERRDGALRVRWSTGGGDHPGRRGGPDTVGRDDGSEVVVDEVVMAVGWPTRTEGLGLDDAGIEHSPGRIPVDAHLRTNVPHVYAPGDANQQDMLVQSARTEAVAAATNAVLGPTRSTPHPLLPWGGFTDPDIAGVGLTEEAARAHDEECVVATVAFAEMERAIIDARTEGFVKLIADRRRSMLLGAHAVGESAVEIVQAVTTAMAAGADPATLARVEFAYPTFSEIIGEAASRLVAA